MAKGKRGLGRGLNALIPESNKKSDGIKGSILKIDISKIKANKDQPRKYFDEEKIDILSDSIKKHGVIQPIIVKTMGDKYEIIAGERRFRAAKVAQLKEIPCIIKDVEERDVVEIALIENLQREDLNPIEEAIAYRNLMDKYKLTQENISSAVGKSRSYIANTIRLINLPDIVKEEVIRGQITSGHARVLLRFTDEHIQKDIMEKVIENNLSVRELEKLVGDLLEEKEIKEKVQKKKDATLLYLEDNLKSLLGTKVNIVKGKKKGKIEIEYYSDDELDRILEFLQK
ncbi:ParB/RepB/Spo0J family partition protein [Anaeromicrobium sediminis]|uniref:Chromosome partitioning protein ParB n=1 Tax=Anaeromicrobium sediminis TaxID=1478221 RepID=A0A267MGB3_9FIRM|nr:ParB/RepB/Spo0J family partition protein [Anaeromicrobium sediminis]PAB58442.1 chromosome partitioning protein ParB [Anaeromicrobium sediminis]